MNSFIENFLGIQVAFARSGGSRGGGSKGGGSKGGNSRGERGQEAPIELDRITIESSPRGGYHDSYSQGDGRSSGGYGWNGADRGAVRIIGRPKPDDFYEKETRIGRPSRDDGLPFKADKTKPLLKAAPVSPSLKLAKKSPVSMPTVSNPPKGSLVDLATKAPQKTTPSKPPVTTVTKTALEKAASVPAAKGDKPASAKTTPTFEKVGSAVGVELAKTSPVSVPKVDNPPKGSLVDLVQQREKAPTSVSFTPNAAGPQNKIAVEDVQTKVNSMVSHSTTVGVAIGNAVDQKVALDIRQQYADTVTKGNAKNFPANQAKADAMIGKQTGSLAKTAASQIKAAHDYGDLVKLEKAAKNGDLPTEPKSKGAIGLADALEANKTAIGIAKTAKVVGNLAGPAVGAVEGYQAVLEDASAAAKMAGAVNGALKQIDNTMISSVVFGVTTVGASPAAGPSLGVVPVAVGVLAASAANATYSAFPAERYVDAVIDAITPGIEKGISLAIQVHDIHGAMLNKGLSTLGEIFE